jgi:hypothetical protein
MQLHIAQLSEPLLEKALRVCRRRLGILVIRISCGQLDCVCGSPIKGNIGRQC